MFHHEELSIMLKISVKIILFKVFCYFCVGVQTRQTNWELKPVTVIKCSLIIINSNTEQNYSDPLFQVTPAAGDQKIPLKIIMVTMCSELPAEHQTSGSSKNR